MSRLATLTLSVRSSLSYDMFSKVFCCSFEIEIESIENKSGTNILKPYTVFVQYLLNAMRVIGRCPLRS